MSTLFWDILYIPHRFDPHGIKYAKIYVNNKLIDNSYTVISSWDKLDYGLNIVVLLNDSGQVIPPQKPDYPCINIDDRTPSELPHHHKYQNTIYPLPNDESITGWVVAVTDNNSVNECAIEIDYTIVYGRQNGTWIPLASNEYNTYIPGDDGGLFLRYPFSGINNQLEPMPGACTNSTLTIHPSDAIKRAWHWWTPSYEASDWSIYDGYKTECKLRIQGQVLAQAGIDFRAPNGDIHELGVSDWYFENGGEWQVVTFETFESGEDTYVTDTVINAGASGCFDSVNNLYVAGNGETVIINSGAEANFIAGESVVLKPGFNATEGSSVNIFISTTNEFCAELGLLQTNILRVDDNPIFIQDTEKEELMPVYPNPGTGVYYINFDGSVCSGEIEILTIQGELLRAIRYRESQLIRLDISYLPDGIYLARVWYNGAVESLKILKAGY